MTFSLASIFLLSLLGLAVAVPYPFSYYRSQYQDEGEEKEQSYISPPDYDAPPDYESQVPEAMMEEEDIFEQDFETQQDLPTDTDMANMQWNYQNDWDKRLHFECRSGEGIDEVLSEHHDKKEDRRWRFDCKKVGSAKESCQWFSRINKFRYPMFFMCPADYYMAGVKSRHSNKREDREWDVKCCRMAKYCTTKCSLTRFINSFDAFMHHILDHGKVFTGLFSSFNGKEDDRVWKVSECNISRC